MSFDQDEIGNITRKGDDSFTYNDRGRMETARVKGVTTSFHYNHLNLRTIKEVKGDANYYIYDTAGNLIAEADNEYRIVKAYVYLHGMRLAMQVLDTEEQNQPAMAAFKEAGMGGAVAKNAVLILLFVGFLALVKYLRASPLAYLLPLALLSCGSKDEILPGQWYFIHADHLDTPHIVTDINQKRVWNAQYEPFRKANVVQEDVSLNLRFPGQYFDEETGLHYNWHRYYDPETGRYLTSDPIGLAGGMNTFTYVLSNPLKLVDSDGLRPCPAGMVPPGTPCYLDDGDGNGYPGAGLCKTADCAFYPDSANTQKPEPYDPVLCRIQPDGSVKCKEDPADANLTCEGKAQKTYNNCLETVNIWEKLCAAGGAPIGGAAGLAAKGYKTLSSLGGAAVGGFAGSFACPGLEDWKDACKQIKSDCEDKCELE